MAEIIQIGSVFNCYLVVGREGSILVDTGSLSARKKILRSARDCHVNLIVLTHGHFDHIANAAYLSRELGVPIAMHQADEVLIKNHEARTLSTDNFIGKMIKRMSGRMLAKSPVEIFEPDFYLSQDMSFDKYGVDATVLELPGHTRGSIGILVGGDKLIAGDAMMNMGGSPASKLFEDKDKMLQSMTSIRKMKCAEVYVGHGRKMKIK